ncbi:hypothetical protein Hypma_001197 [Hypsizygus marmoreus]|uniref:Uncharacterized protein n=1 Tax=Hypsizygus marmoreus TaxID=39966 RepID=A0A369J6X5_HYPMA|nr:hypothetical protein Hypma_001197 [Hypsizygus marmoreus]
MWSPTRPIRMPYSLVKYQYRSRPRNVMPVGLMKAVGVPILSPKFTAGHLDLTFDLDFRHVTGQSVKWRYSIGVRHYRKLQTMETSRLHIFSPAALPLSVMYLV